MGASLKAGVIGLGVMGAEHVRLLDKEVSGVEVTNVYDVNTERAVAVAEQHSAKTATDPLQLIRDPQVDLVLVASSDATHERFVLAALDARKPVLCEKPLAPSLDACRRIVDTEVALGRRLISLGFMRRFDPGLVALRQRVHGGSVGDALIVHCVHRNATNASRDAAALITGSLVHEIDMARWLLDDELTSIAIHGPRANAADAPTDPIVAVLRSESGAYVDAEVFANAGYGYEVRCEVVGRSGTLLFDRRADVSQRVDARISTDVDRDWRDRFGDAYRRELQEWVDSVAEGRTSTAASAWDGYAAIAVGDAGIRAASTGRFEQVDLGPRPELYS